MEWSCEDFNNQTLLDSTSLATNLQHDAIDSQVIFELREQVQELHNQFQEEVKALKADSEKNEKQKRTLRHIVVNISGTVQQFLDDTEKIMIEVSEAEMTCAVGRFLTTWKGHLEQSLRPQTTPPTAGS